MKLNAALAKSLLMAASIGIVVPLVAQTGSKKVAPKADPAQPAPPEGAAPQLPGTVIAREDGRFLSLSLDGMHFKLSFYDANKVLVEPDAVRAVARWDPVNKAGVLRAVLNPSEDGKALKGNVLVRPPYVFKVQLLLIGADDNTIESHSVDFRG
jgi:hypothetical protein